METVKREKLEAAGFRVTSVEEFLGLTPAEVSMIDTRIALTRALRERRRATGVSQAELAAKVGTSQSRIAKVESGGPNISLDLLFRSLFATGASPADVGAIVAECSAHIEPAK